MRIPEEYGLFIGLILAYIAIKTYHLRRYISLPFKKGASFIPELEYNQITPGVHHKILGRKISYDQITKSYLFLGFKSLEAGVFRKHFQSKHELEIEAEHLEIEDGMKILDLGCGVGEASFYFHSLKKIEIDMVTNSRYQYDLIQKKIKPQMNVFFEDFDHMKFKKDYYDRVILLESIGYSKDLDKLLNKIYQSLKVGGRIYIKTPTFSHNKRLVWLKQNVARTWNYNHSTEDNLSFKIERMGFESIRSYSLPLYLSDNLIKFYLLFIRTGLYKVIHMSFVGPKLSTTIMATKRG